ncbi:MAG: hypothetical protein LUD72_09915 [Bacteroidales bacterium]|nr:hypothetical protein [Bacteroidales bacterium]
MKDSLKRSDNSEISLQNFEKPLHQGLAGAYPACYIRQNARLGFTRQKIKELKIMKK